MITTWLTLGIVVLILTGAIIKIIREKKKGVKCIGCPASHACSRSACSNAEVCRSKI